MNVKNYSSFIKLFFIRTVPNLNDYIYDIKEQKLFCYI